MTDEAPLVKSDSRVVRRHRAHQGMVREALGWPPGPPSDARARSAYPVLPNYFAEEHEGSTPEQVGVNLVPPSAAEYARQRLEQLAKVNGVAEPDRLWRNLMSSQPLAFSIAGHLRDHQAGAAELFGRLTGLEVVGFSRLEDGNAPKHTLDGIDAEWFPPRQHHTNDRSGFDIAALLELAGGTHTLLTIEVKYIDSFSPAKLDPSKEGYASALSACGIKEAETQTLTAAGGSQFLRSVLLTDSVRRKGIAGATTPAIDEALAVVLGRVDDVSAQRVVEKFDALDLRTKTDYWSHNQFFDAAASVEVLAEWAADLRRRYVLSD